MKWLSMTSSRLQNEDHLGNSVIFLLQSLKGWGYRLLWCMSVYAWICVHIGVCAGAQCVKQAWRWKVNLECHSSGPVALLFVSCFFLVCFWFFCLFFEKNLSLTWSWPSRLACLFLPMFGLQAWATTAHFLCGFWGSNSGFYVCSARTWLAEPSPRTPIYRFWRTCHTIFRL